MARERVARNGKKHCCRTSIPCEYCGELNKDNIINVNENKLQTTLAVLYGFV